MEQVKAKRQHYEEIDIHQIIERINKEGELKIRQQSLKHQEETLTSKNQSVKSKYDTLLQEVDNQLREYQLQSGGQLNAIERERMEILGRLQTEQNERQDAIRAQYKLKLDENQRQLDEARQTKNDLRVQEQQVRQANPYQGEMEEQERKGKALGERQHLLERDSNNKQREIDRIINETDKQRRELEIECEKKVATIETDIKQITVEIEKLDDMLSRQKGSLIEWLGENVNGWEENIGKVLDEDSVLYNTALNPQLLEKTDSIYGIKIDIQRTITISNA
jgi:chromosome segregation ATPase